MSYGALRAKLDSDSCPVGLDFAHCYFNPKFPTLSLAEIRSLVQEKHSKHLSCAKDGAGNEDTGARYNLHAQHTSCSAEREPDV